MWQSSFLDNPQVLVRTMLAMEEDSEMYVPLNKSYPKNYISNDGDNCLKVWTSSVDWVNKSFTELSINCSDTKLESEMIKDDKCLAGNIQSIITTMGLVLIQPLLPNLLYLETRLFLCNPNSNDQNSTNYIYLGKIDDIFGSVKEPMYAVYHALETMNVLNIGDQVYFLPNDPDTQSMYVEHALNNSFNIVKKKTISK